MDFSDIILKRQSCRKYDPQRKVEESKLEKILTAAHFSPSACNSQPYFITVCKGEVAKKVAKETQKMGRNGFTADADVMLVLSENDYNERAGKAAEEMKNDFRSLDIGILSAYITAAAAEEGLGSCILGLFDNDNIKEICSISGDVRLCISIGYPASDDVLRDKVRKPQDELIKILD